MEKFGHLIAEQEALVATYARRSLAYFLENIVINSSPEPQRFGAIADPWQRELIAPMIPAVDGLAGLNPGYSGPWRFMQILARGHNKSSLEAWVACFLALASRRIIHGYIIASDADQGRLIIQAAEDLLRLNPWLAVDVAVQKNRIEGPGGVIEVLPRDARSAMGLRGNFYIIDEFVHWPRQDEWNSIITGLRKVKPTMVVAISNAGLRHTWQHEAFLDAQNHPSTWRVFYKIGTLASWLDPAGIEEDRRMVPPSEARRLYDNCWIDPTEEHDYLRLSEIELCASLGVRLGLTYRLRRQYGVSNYVAAIDYGPRRDRTALVVLHQDSNRVVRVDRLDCWQGSQQAPVQITAVEEWINDVRAGFNPSVFVIDPYQMESTIQWCQRKNIPVEAFAARAGAGNYQMAQHLRALVVDQRLAWYEGAGDLMVDDRRRGRIKDTLVDELANLRTKKMSYGYRFDHENQRHDDRAVVIAMAALRAAEYGTAESNRPPYRKVPETAV